MLPVELRSIRPRRFRQWLLSAVLLASGCTPLTQLPAVLDVRIGAEQSGIVGENLLNLQISSSARSTLVLTVCMHMIAGEDTLMAQQRIRLPPASDSRFSLAYQVERAGVYAGRLSIYPEGRPELLYQKDDLSLVVLPRLTFSADRSYYTGESRLHFQARLRQVRPERHSLAVELISGDEVVDYRQDIFRHQTMDGAFDLTMLSTGSYKLRARLYGPAGLEAVVERRVRKLAPASREVKIDLFTRGLLVDGEPFFPIGLYWLRSELLGEIRHLGFNSGDYYYKLQDDEISELMHVASDQELGILLELTDLVRLRPEPDLSAIGARIQRYRDYPALLAWYIVDEPADIPVNPKQVRLVYQLIQELDPYHPVYLVNNRPETYSAYLETSDILAANVYPVPTRPLRRVRDLLQKARRVGLGEKPVWLVAQAFGGVEHWPRAPEPAELRNMVYQGLVQGARGVFFYRFCEESERHIQPVLLWHEMCRLVAELGELTPALNGRDMAEAVQVVAGRDVDALVKEYEAGYCLLVVNHATESRQVDLRFSGLPGFQSAEARWDSPPAAVGPGELRVVLGPLGVGVYELILTET